MIDVLDNNSYLEAHTVFTRFTASDELREKFRAREKWRMDQANLRAEAEEEGMAKGIARGIEKGIEQGIEQGKEEGIKLTAKNLKRAGVSLETIMDVTGLSREEIKSL